MDAQRDEQTDGDISIIPSVKFIRAITSLFSGTQKID